MKEGIITGFFWERPQAEVGGGWINNITTHTRLLPTVNWRPPATLPTNSLHWRHTCSEATGRRHFPLRLAGPEPLAGLARPPARAGGATPASAAALPSMHWVDLRPAPLHTTYIKHTAHSTAHYKALVNERRYIKQGFILHNTLFLNGNEHYTSYITTVSFFSTTTPNVHIGAVGEVIFLNYL